MPAQSATLSDLLSFDLESPGAGDLAARVAADTCCPHCGHRPVSAKDQLSTLIAAILALPRHRDGRKRTSGRTAAERRTGHTEDVTYKIEIVPSNLPGTGQQVP